MFNEVLSTVEGKSQEQFSISVDESIVESFGIERINDYIHVQRKVFQTLQKEGFFTKSESSRIDINAESGLIIETNKSGIEETFNRENYAIRGKELKLWKLATIRIVPDIIKKGHIVADNVSNSHKNDSSLKYTYIESDVVIDEILVKVKLSIRKSSQKNKFWVHHVYIEKGAGSTSAVNSKVHKTAHTSSSTEDRIAQNDPSVKNESESYSIPEDSIEKYTEEEYNHHGWASVNCAISGKELSVFYRKIAEIKTGTVFSKNGKRQTIIPVGEKFGVENVLVFTNGNYDSPSIDKVIRIDLDTATEIEFLREAIYNGDFTNVEQDNFCEDVFGKTLVSRYDVKAFETYSEISRRRSSIAGRNSNKAYENNQRKQNRGRDTQKSPRFEIRFDDDTDYSIPSETADIYDRYDRGEISREELTAALQKEWMKAGEQYGTYERCACCLLHR